MRRQKDVPCELCPDGFANYFNRLDNADLQYLNEQKITRRYKKGQVIFEEGSKPQGVFCLREGEVKVFKYGRNGREQITRILFPGELLGLKAILSGCVYSVSATTLEESVLCFINKTEFFQLMLKYPAFNNSMIILLSKLLEQAEIRMISLAHKPVKERLAETLIYLNHSFSCPSTSLPNTYLNLSRQDLANIIGTAPETVCRLLTEWKEKKIITIKGRKIFINTENDLFKISNCLS